MDIEQLKSGWQHQLAQPLAHEQQSWKNKMIVIEGKMLALDRHVKRRTLYGTIMFVLMLLSMIILGYGSYRLGAPLMSVLGLGTWFVLFAITVSRLFVMKRRNSPSDNTLSIKASLQHQLARVESEIGFYQTIVYKILAPMSIGLVLILGGVKQSLSGVDSQISFFTYVFFSLSGFLFCCYLSYRYNKHYVAKELTPIKQEISLNLNALNQ